MAKMKAKKKRNPQDTTFRNINALKRRVAKLETKAGALDLVEAVAVGLNQIAHELRRTKAGNG